MTEEMEVMEGQMSVYDPDTWSGKTSLEPCPPQESGTEKITEEKISKPSSAKSSKSSKQMPQMFLYLKTEDGPTQDVSWVSETTDSRFPSPGEYMTHSFGESPREENVSRLSQILEANPHPKYYLSEKACQGILRRAEKRGKELPPMLKEALLRQSVSKSELESQETKKAIGFNGWQSVTANMPTLEERVPPIEATMPPNVVYGIGGYNSEGMKSDNPHSGIYEAETSRTLDLNGGSPACNQGGMAVVQGADIYNGELTGETATTLTAASGGATASGPKVVCAEPIPINTMVGTRTTDETRTTFGVGSPGDPQFTLSSAHSHAVAYRKTSHAKSAEDGQETEVNDTVVVEGFDSYNLQPTGDVGRTLTTPSGGLNEHMPVVLENHPNDSRVKISEDGKVQTLSGRMGTGGGNVPMVMETYQETTGSLCASGYDKLGTQEAMNDMFVVEGSSWDGSQTSPTLIANNAGGNQRMSDKDNFNAVVQSMEVFHCTNDEERVQTLKARDYKDPQVVAYGLDRASFNQGENAKFDFSVEEEKIGAQVARGPGAVCSENAVVRRLTPLECERLQGFPDNWTNIGDWVDSKGKTHKGESDSPRYKALGNSIALPFWMWMAERMVNVLKEDGVENPTMASLFDGIGGFPYSYERVGCKAVWASEIEEFPIAVTKIRFPDIDE